MTTLIIDNKEINFSSINELKIYVYENFWYPEIKEEIEESWNEGWNDWEEIKDVKKFISDIKNKNV